MILNSYYLLIEPWKFATHFTESLQAKQEQITQQTWEGVAS